MPGLPTSGSPPLYPDAVTFEPTVTAAQLLPRIDGGAGCSVKDSFATLDLAPDGFRVLFDAEWIGREPATAGDDRCVDARRRSRIELAPWETAWSGGDAPADLFRPALLEPLTVAFLAERIGRMIVSGAVLSYGADVVGVSNLFAENGDLDAAWTNAIAAAATYFPRAPIVGYESGDALAAARRSGFEVLGPLRVWINDARTRPVQASSSAGGGDDEQHHRVDREQHRAQHPQARCGRALANRGPRAGRARRRGIAWCRSRPRRRRRCIGGRRAARRERSLRGLYDAGPPLCCFDRVSKQHRNSRRADPADAAA